MSNTYFISFNSYNNPRRLRNSYNPHSVVDEETQGKKG